MYPDPEAIYDLSDLCDRAGVTQRTVRYYVQQGLLPAPGKGPGTRYGRGHLDRLRLIRQLQREHLPLAEIRKRLDRLDDGQVAAALRAAAGGQERAAAVAEPARPPHVPGESVAEYVAGVLGEPHAARRSLSTSTSSSVSRGDASAGPYARDRWDRFRLTDEVEIHVRRPLSRETNRRVEKLLEAARDILGEEP